MFEFIVRSVFAASLVAASFLLARPTFELAWRAAALYAAFAFLSFLLERRGLRTQPLSAALALSDSAMIALGAAKLGYLPLAGAACGLPLAAAIMRHRALAPTVLPMGPALVLVAQNALVGGSPEPAVLGQAVGALALAAVGLVSLRKAAQPPAEPVAEPEAFTPILPGQPTPEPEPQEDSPELELRERYRQLREHTLQVEQKARRGRWLLQLSEVADSEGNALYSGLAATLREITGASGLSLYTVSAVNQSLIVRAASGDVPKAAETRRVPIARNSSEASLREVALKALRDQEHPLPATTVMLRSRSKLLGMIWLNCESEASLQTAKDKAENCVDLVARIIERDQREMDLRARLVEMETLYTVSGAALGSETPRTLLARVARELADALKPDYLGALLLDGSDLLPVSTEGTLMRLVEDMSFAQGPGVEGWLATGAPGLEIHDTHDDLRCPREIALKKRIGSFCLYPIRVQGEVYGALAAGANRVGGLHDKLPDTLRVVAGELGHAIARLEGQEANQPGLVTPTELQAALRHGHGCLVVLDPLRKEELRSEFGKESLEFCVRKFATRLRPLAPGGSMICRRKEDIVVFLPDTEEFMARQWANEAAATAFLTTFADPATGKTVPFAVRAKVSAYAPDSATSNSHVQIASS